LEVQSLRFSHLGHENFQFPVCFVFGKCSQRKIKTNSGSCDKGIDRDSFDRIQEIMDFDKYFYNFLIFQGFDNEPIVLFS
jgi:hypothetical protein